MDSIKVSVIMAVYDTKEDYLREAIESILNQTFKNFEFIIINDGSIIDVENVILSYKDDRIVYLKQENKGIVGALNNGWDHANGKYIARMDSDDVAYPERFEKQVKFLEENPEYSLVGGQARILGTNKKVSVTADVRLIDLLADCAFVHPSIMFRKADFDKYNLRYTKEAEFAEDYILYAKAIKHLKMTNLNDIVIDYRIYPENSSSANREARVKSSFKVQDLILDYISKDEKEKRLILDIAYKKKVKTRCLKERIFSIKNMYKNWAKYKLVTILGFEFYIVVTKYDKN